MTEALERVCGGILERIESSDLGCRTTSSKREARSAAPLRARVVRRTEQFTVLNAPELRV